MEPNNNPENSAPESDTQPLAPSAMNQGITDPNSLGAIPAPSIPPPNPPASSSGAVLVVPEMAKSGGSSKKPVMIAVIIVLLIAILGTGGYFAYKMTGVPEQTEEQTETTVDNTGKDLDNLETETQGIQITDPESDLVEINQDINALDPSASPSASAVIDR